MKKLIIIPIAVLIGIASAITIYESYQNTKLEDVNNDLLNQLKINLEPYATDMTNKCTSDKLIEYLSSHPCSRRTVSYYEIADFNTVIEETSGMRASLKEIEFGGGVSTVDVINKTTSYFRASRSLELDSVKCNISMVYPFESEESIPYRYVRERADSTLMIISNCSY